MKLSDIKGDRCFEVIADLVGPIASIAEDKDVLQLFERKSTPEGMTSKEFFIKRMKEGLPALLKGHKKEFIQIMAILNDQDPKEYNKNVTMATLLKDVVDLITDDELVSFLS